MEWCEEDHRGAEEPQEEEQLSNQSILPLATQEPEMDSIDEWDADLETDGELQ